MCNWMGNKEWSLALDSPFHAELNEKKDHPWHLVGAGNPEPIGEVCVTTFSDSKVKAMALAYSFLLQAQRWLWCRQLHLRAGVRCWPHGSLRYAVSSQHLLSPASSL